MVKGAGNMTYPLTWAKGGTTWGATDEELCVNNTLCRYRYRPIKMLCKSTKKNHLELTNLSII